MHWSLQSVAIFTLLATYCQAQRRAEILIGPRTRVVAPGELVTFVCHAIGESVYWYVNGSDPYPLQKYEARGFTFHYNETSSNTHNNTLIVEARPSNNNTRIACAASGSIHNQHGFQEGTLIIAGPPLRPQMINFSRERISDSNNFTHCLDWSAPFTWPGFPVISYSITVFNHSSNQSTVDDIVYVNESSAGSHSWMYTSYGESCYGLTFYLAARNALDEGEFAMIRTGHPIVPSKVGDIETTVSFLSNGTPHLWMSFSAPNICPGYQTGMYRIRITDNDTSTVYAFQSTEYTQDRENEMMLIVKEVKTGLKRSEHYVIEVASSSVGKDQNKSKTFHTFLDENLLYARVDQLINCSRSASNLAIIIGVSVGGGIALTYTLLCLCTMLTLCLTCRRKSNRMLSRTPIVEPDGAHTVWKEKKPKTLSKPPNLTLQAKNPIYEGAMYETTPGESLKSLLSPSSVPCTPLADAAIRYTFDFPPRLPPPRKGSVSIPPKLETHDEVKDSFKMFELPGPKLETNEEVKDPLKTFELSGLAQNSIGDEYVTMDARGFNFEDGCAKDLAEKSDNLPSS